MIHGSTLTKLSVAVFVLAVASFLIRGIGQFVVGVRAATLLAGPVAVAALALLVVVAGIHLLDRVGLATIDR